MNKLFPETLGDREVFAMPDKSVISGGCLRMAHRRELKSTERRSHRRCGPWRSLRKMGASDWARLAAATYHMDGNDAAPSAGTCNACVAPWDKVRLDSVSEAWDLPRVHGLNTSKIEPGPQPDESSLHASFSTKQTKYHGVSCVSCKLYSLATVRML